MFTLQVSAIYSDPVWPLCELTANLQNEKRVHLKPMSAPPLNLFGPADWYRTIRDQIQHEDNLIVQRLSWLMAAQSFFFTGYAIIANATPQAQCSFGQTTRPPVQYHSSGGMHFQYPDLLQRHRGSTGALPAPASLCDACLFGRRFS